MKTAVCLFLFIANIVCAEDNFKMNQFNLNINESISYLSDLPGKEVWQSPSQTLELKTGDCEDIAILKYYLLQQTISKDTEIRLAYSWLKTENSHTPHMVLLIRNGPSDEFKVLDNTTSLIFYISERSDIEVIVSFNNLLEYKGFSNIEIHDKQLSSKLSNALFSLQ